MKPKFCTIYLVRHGETVWNTQDRVQGQTDAPLTQAGLAQAKNLAQNLKPIRFSAVYSSDLGRAYQTAQTIALEHQLLVTTTQLMRERRQGKLEGKLWHELQQELKAELLKRDQLSYQDRFRYSFGEGYESDESLVSRAITFLRQISLAHLSKKVLVVSHGGIMKALLIHLGFATYQELPTSCIQNTAYVVLRSDGTDFFIDSTVGITKKTVV